MKNQRWYVRCAAAVAAVVLFTGCDAGSGSVDSGGRAGKVAETLTAKQVISVLPDAHAMAGWRKVEEAVARRSTYPEQTENPHSMCPLAISDKTPCTDVRLDGRTAYLDPESETDVLFWVFTYRDEKAAAAAHTALWKNFYSHILREDPTQVDLENIGDGRFARRGNHPVFGRSTMSLIRVGTTLRGINTSHSRTALPDKQLTALATMFAERAQQALDGKKPTAVATAG
ncbi:hypothetical protein ACWEQP_10905 [Streptomyces sp. NPDC004044]